MSARDREHVPFGDREPIEDQDRERLRRKRESKEVKSQFSGRPMPFPGTELPGWERVSRRTI